MLRLGRFFLGIWAAYFNENSDWLKCIFFLSPPREVVAFIAVLEAVWLMKEEAFWREAGVVFFPAPPLAARSGKLSV